MLNYAGDSSANLAINGSQLPIIDKPFFEQIRRKA